MKYVVHGATGAQGGPLYDLLTKAGHTVVAIVRDPSAHPGLNAAKADIGSSELLAQAYQGADGVFIHLPIASEADRVKFCDSIALAIAKALPKRVVISTSGFVVDDPNSSLTVPPESAIRSLISRIEQAGVSVAVIAPRLYLENLLMPLVSQPMKGEGVLRYPLPADYQVSWCSHLDIADVAVRLFKDTAVTGVVGVGAMPGLNGNDLATSFAEYLGQPVRYEGVEPKQFGALLEPFIGIHGAAEVVGVYEAQARSVHNTILNETSAQTLLGLTPRSVKQWLQDLNV
ncbi:uncharacterized protein YbjT (DUF2867 family) [Pseudomonas sp. BIGb0408]|uniref:Uncharacterized protein YbjT (DUF2867 family) n=1 Tax=Phytopseudomonas flavescens TaxID=29435 RepID=A0A7Z0BPM5_9GAMM|nr:MULTISPECIES: NmrA family NAD(P)-binding protein [Pseudomonas]MCW2293153.1 uncharacterized protein YbjT (DUF2867 family) [Pseudomonas sp. BIGb0408]NYH72276.1 uncharacterized protein YbjT (DUF2867 family) [Pseudomonas flavescens]